MNDMERRRFEDSFRDAFQEAEITPSESVWTNIELDLERAEGGKMKRRLLFYKLLAAASVAFAMSVAGVGYYTMKNQTGDAHQIAQLNNDTNSSSAETKTSDVANPQLTPSNSLSNDHALTDQASASNSNTSTSTSGLTSAVNSHANPDVSGKTVGSHQVSQQAADLSRGNQSVVNTQVVQNPINTVGGNSVENTFNRNGIAASISEPTTSAFVLDHSCSNGVRSLPSKIKPEHSLVSSNQVEVDPVAAMMAKQMERERELAEEQRKEDRAKKNSEERLWTSVGVAAGGFSAVNTNVSPTVSSFNTAANQQATASGVAYTMGVSVGTRLSNRWVLQGGVNYQMQSSDYTANSVIGTSDFQDFYAASISNDRESLETKILSTAPYSVNNNLQFVSVPMQAGYLVINKKFGVQLNAGLSTDLFLQSTITPEGGSLDKTTQGRGDESPYRSVNFSGLVGTELTYKFGSHYRVALNPGLRYPMSSIYKSDTGIESSPLTFDVGLRFRYIFQP